MFRIYYEDKKRLGRWTIYQRKGVDWYTLKDSRPDYNDILGRKASDLATIDEWNEHCFAGEYKTLEELIKDNFIGLL